MLSRIGLQEGKQPSNGVGNMLWEGKCPPSRLEMRLQEGCNAWC
jgi:hypothetical protein